MNVTKKETVKLLKKSKCVCLFSFKTTNDQVQFNGYVQLKWGKNLHCPRKGTLSCPQNSNIIEKAIYPVLQNTTKLLSLFINMNKNVKICQIGITCIVSDESHKLRYTRKASPSYLSFVSYCNYRSIVLIY